MNETPSPEQTEQAHNPNTAEHQPSDIFAWANQTDAAKNELEVEFFLFNKGFTPYFTTVSDELDAQLKPLFLLDMMSQVELGAGTGLTIRDYELSEKEDNVVYYLQS